jgi:hypothetical protein
MNLQEVRTGLANALHAIPNLRIYPTVPESPQVPCAILVPESIRYGQTFDGAANVRVTIHVLAASINAEGGQRLLDEYVADEGNQSIAKAIEDDPTLGGQCQYAQVVEMRSYGVMGDTTRYYSAELSVDVWAQ